MKKFLSVLSFAAVLASCTSHLLADPLVIYESTKGTKFGTQPTQGLGFFGTAPVTQPANSLTSRQALVSLGLLAAGGADPADTFTLSTSNTLGDGTNIILGGTTGTKIGTSATAQKLGFFNATPIVQPHSANQTALTDSTGGSTANATLAAVTAPSALTDSTTGTASTTLAALADLSTSDTYSDAALNAKLLVIKNALASVAARQAEDLAAITALTNAVAKEAKLLNELRSDLVALGLIKGAN